MTGLAWALLCLFIFSIPWEKSLYVPAIGTIARLLGLAAAAAGALAALQRRALRLPNLALVLAAVFIAWSAATWFWSYDRAATGARAFTLLQLFAMAYLVWDQCRTRERISTAMAAYVAGAVVASGATIARYFENQQTYYRRYAAAGFDPNDLGVTLALAVPLALYLALAARPWAAWLYRAGTGLMLMAILLTASRTALICALAGLAFSLWTWRSSDWTQRASSAGLILLLLAGAIWLAPPASRQRISTLGTELTRGTLHKRTTIWKAGLRAFKRRPLRGVGSGAYPEAVRPWLGTPPVPGHEYVAHNSFLSVLVETGTIGCGFYALLLGTLAVFVWMMAPVERALWATVLVVWAAGAATLTWEHRKPTWLIFAVIMAAWAVAWKSRSYADKRT